VRGTSVTGFHFFQGCAPGAVVTMWTGFTATECELLRIRYASLLRADPTTPYAVPYLCSSNDCNGAVGTSLDASVTGGCSSSGVGGGGAAAAAAAASLAAAALSLA
jgi:hypothetical protein